MRMLAMFAALLLPMVALRSQEPAPVEATCRTCGGAGQLPCSKHGKTLALELEALPADARVLACSGAVACKTCEGALVIDCVKCTNADVEQELESRRRLAREWLAQRRAHVDKAPGHATFEQLSTTHFELVFSLEAMTVDRKKLDPHALMHRYGARLEELRAKFAATLELDDTDLPDRCRVYMFRDARDHAVVGPQETGFGAAGSSGLKLMGPEFVYSMWREPRTMPDDESVHRNIVHNVTHLLLSEMRPMLFLGNKRHGWIDEGVAHWFEDALTGRCTNFCFEEVLLQPGAGFKGGRWRVPVRKLVDEGKAVSFAELSGLNTDQLTFEQHAVAFAYVDFLLQAHGGARFRDFLRLVKQGQATRDALEAVYEQNPLTIEPSFRDWVQEHYPLRER